MPPIRIYTDESIRTAFAEELKRRGIEAWSARDAGKLGLSDEEQLAYAAREQAVIFTHDNDFLRLAHEWMQQGREHWGILYVHQYKLGIGECLRRLMKYALLLTPDDMRNRLEFL